MKFRLAVIPALLLLVPRPGSPGEFLRGEVNRDGKINLSDPVFILTHLFLAGDPPDCEDAADVDDDGRLDLSDAVYELGYLFAGGPRPPWPGPSYAAYDGTPGDPFTCGDEPGEISVTEDELFERLTRNAWVRIEPSLFTTVTSYAFQRSGRYFYCSFSDIPEGADAGSWNFEKTTPGGGALFLDGKSLIQFSLRADGRLRLINKWFEPGEFIGLSFECQQPPADCGGCTRPDLPAVDLPPLAETLANTQWLKASDFDTYRKPTRLDFLAPGRYAAVFREGECSFTSSWSLTDDFFLFENPDPDCDFRDDGIPGPGPWYHGRHVLLEGDSLRFDDQEVYLRQGSDLTRGQLVLMVGHRNGPNGYNASLVGTYERPFRRGANAFHFQARPLQPIGFPYGELTFIRSSLRRTGNGFVAAGEPEVLAQVTLPAVLPENGFEFDVNLAAPDAAGDFFYEVDVEANFWLFPRSFVATLP